MSPKVKTGYEKRRGCGFRKSGRLYLVAPGDEEPCYKLPLRLDVCPTCQAGCSTPFGIKDQNTHGAAPHNKKFRT